MKVNDIIFEGAATATAKDSSLWQSTKDAVGKATDTVTSTIPKSVSKTLSDIGKNKAVRVGTKALAPVGTALGAYAIPDDAYDAMKNYDKGDKVGAWLKGSQAAVNAAMVPTTIAALAPTPVQPLALGADAVLGLTSAGLAGAEYARDKWFPYDGDKKGSKKAEPTDESLNRIVHLKNYKTGVNK